MEKNAKCEMEINKWKWKYAVHVICYM